MKSTSIWVCVYCSCWLSVWADMLEWVTISRATINSLFCVKYLLCSVQSFTFATRLKVSTNERSRLPVNSSSQKSQVFCLQKDQKNDGGVWCWAQLYPPAGNAAVSDLVTLDTSWETFLLLQNPSVNFQYLMSWWAVAASGNPQWCDWWISQYSDLFSSKLTRLACQHGLTDHINP